MVVSGDYVFSGKLLSCNPMDKDRSEHAWRTLLQPFKTTRSQVTAILYGSQKKEVQKLTTSNSKYTLDDFKPSDEDSALIPFLMNHVIKRRENIVLVGPPGCGKSCLVEAITMKYGVQFFGTPDELKEISNDAQFVAFDDFDFSNFTVDDVKRLLDREFQE
jgi:ATP-dependent Clp protease ATP-binding subunit ClpA